MEFLKLKNIAAWSVFIVALVVYILTAQQSVMFWDSGEFIASSIKLQATHPPGAPLYTMLSRVFLLFFPQSYTAFGASIFSSLCGAFTVFFLFHLIVWLGKKMLVKTESEASNQMLICSAVIGSLALVFSDSFWISSTEAEVYTLSTLLMAISFWAVTKWEEGAGSRGNIRWLLLIGYLLGLSMGVHILNLAVLFPIVMVIALKLYSFNLKSISIGIGAALILFVLLNSLLVKGVLKFLIGIELAAINNWGWAQHYGALLGAIIFLGLLVSGMVFAAKRHKKIVELSLFGILVFTLGWSSYTMAVIRTEARTPTSNNAENIVRLLDYVNSDQFGFAQVPLLNGPSFNSPKDGSKKFLNGNPTYTYDDESSSYYVSQDGRNSVPNYLGNTKMLFPRMWSNEPINIIGYKRWIDFEGKLSSIKVVTNGRQGPLRLPTMGENLSFFFNYQLGWLNFRYFMWNFSGRQNDIRGIGHPSAGNWVSGIPFIDSGRIGSSEVTPEYHRTHKGNNEFYLLPLILGIVGAVFMFKRGQSSLVVMALFFLAFGVAITIFINQLPIHIQIRERDYIFLGAYYAFCGFIGIGALGVFHWLPATIIPSKFKLPVVATVCFLAVPFLMGFQGWDDHDRSNDNSTRVLAAETLAQCDKDAILFVSGDNLTFPLWYLQEAEGIRTDVRVIDYNLLGLDWYVKKLKLKSNESAPLKMKLSNKFYETEQKNAYRFQKNSKVKGNVELTKLIEYIGSTKAQITIPTNLFKLSTNLKSSYLKGINPADFGLNWTSTINWELKKNQYNIKDIAMFDLIAQNDFDRPVYFSNAVNGSFNMGLEKYFLNKGLVNQFLPIEPSQMVGHIDEESVEELLNEKMDFSYFSDSTQFVNSLSAGFARKVYMNLFIDLARELNKKGDDSGSDAVLDRMLEVLPNKTLYYESEGYKAAGMYFANDNISQWRKLSILTMNNYIQEASWLLSFEPQHEIHTFKRVELLTNQITSMINDVARFDAELAKEFEPQLSQLDMDFKRWVASNELLEKTFKRGVQ